MSGPVQAPRKRQLNNEHSHLASAHKSQVPVNQLMEPKLKTGCTKIKQDVTQHILSMFRQEKVFIIVIWDACCCLNPTGDTCCLK